MAEKVLQNILVKEVELSLIAEEAGFVDGKIFQQPGEFLLSFLADQQPVIAIEGIETALF